MSSKDIDGKRNLFRFAELTKRKAFWAARIFEQWCCIHNFKVKQDPIKATL